MLSLSEAQIDHLWNRIREGATWIENGEKDNFLWCLKSTLPLDTRGYPKSLRLTKAMGDEDGVCWVPSSFGWPPAQIAMLWNNKIPPSNDVEASHLCNHTWCLNPEHLVWETRATNAARKNCRIWTTCPCPCNKGFNPCTHEPKCTPLKYCFCDVHVKFNPLV